MFLLQLDYSRSKAHSMHLTRFTDYSIRVLIFLAVKGEERSTINEIAETFDISRNHLMKVVQELSQKTTLPLSGVRMAAYCLHVTLRQSFWVSLCEKWNMAWS